MGAMIKNVKLKKPESTESLLKLFETLFKRFERLELRKLEIIANNPEIFDEIQSMDNEMDELREQMKKLMYTTKGPPAGWGKFNTICVGELLKAEITYKRKSDFYDPAKLPWDVLKKPGIIVEVDTLAVKELGDDRCEKAVVTGNWMTPSLSIKRKE